MALGEKAPVFGQIYQKGSAGAALHFWFYSAPAWVGRQKQISPASWTWPPLLMLMLLAKDIPKAALKTRLAYWLHGPHPEHSRKEMQRGTQVPQTSSAQTLRVLAEVLGAPRPCAQHQWGNLWVSDRSGGLQTSPEATWTLMSSMEAMLLPSFHPGFGKLLCHDLQHSITLAHPVRKCLHMN